LYTETAFSLATALTEAGEVVVSGIGIVWNLMTGNAWLTFMLGVTLISLGFRFFRKAKRAAH